MYSPSLGVQSYSWKNGSGGPVAVRSRVSWFSVQITEQPLEKDSMGNGLVSSQRMPMSCLENEKREHGPTVSELWAREEAKAPGKWRLCNTQSWKELDDKRTARENFFLVNWDPLLQDPPITGCGLTSNLGQIREEEKETGFGIFAR